MQTVIIVNATKALRTLNTAAGPVRCLPGESRFSMDAEQKAAFDKALAVPVVKRWFEHGILSIADPKGASAGHAAPVTHGAEANETGTNDRDLRSKKGGK